MLNACQHGVLRPQLGASPALLVALVLAALLGGARTSSGQTSAMDGVPWFSVDQEPGTNGAGKLIAAVAKERGSRWATQTGPGTSPRHRHIFRQRTAPGEVARLRALEPGPDATFAFDLFEDARLRARLEQKTSRAADDQSFSGTLLAPEEGRFSLVAKKGALTGILWSVRRQKIYRITSVAGEAVVVSEAGDSGCGGCDVGRERPLPEGEVVQAQADGTGGAWACGDDGSVVDLLVLYTSGARAAAGGQSDIEAEAQLAVDVANQAYAASRIAMRLRLVRTEEVSYGGAGTFGDHLDRLASRSDGIMDDVHATRDILGADLVSLLVNDDDGGTLCGRAGVLRDLDTPSERSAFSIVNWECAAADYSLAHELGHNMGCGHDSDNVDTEGLFPYSHGWRFYVYYDPWEYPLPFVLYRTVMAYTPGIRIGVFSNPDVTISGVPTGVADVADNARTINNSAYTVANRRTSVMWVEFGYTGSGENGGFDAPFNTLAEAVEAVPSCGTIRIKAGSGFERLTMLKSVTVLSHNGTAVIGQ